MTDEFMSRLERARYKRQFARRWWQRAWWAFYAGVLEGMGAK